MDKAINILKASREYLENRMTALKEVEQNLRENLERTLNKRLEVVEMLADVDSALRKLNKDELPTRLEGSD